MTSEEYYGRKELQEPRTLKSCVLSIFLLIIIGSVLLWSLIIGFIKLFNSLLNMIF